MFRPAFLTLAAFAALFVFASSPTLAAPPGSLTITTEQTNAEEKPSISLEGTSSLRETLLQILDAADVSYIIGAGVTGDVTVKMKSVPFERALTLILSSATPQLTYRIENGVYIFVPKPQEKPTGEAREMTEGPQVTSIEETPRPDPIIDALEMQAAQLEVRREVTLLSYPKDSLTVQQADVELKAIRSVIDRRRQFLVKHTALNGVPRLQTLLEKRNSLVAAGYRPDSLMVRELNTQIRALQQQASSQ